MPAQTILQECYGNEKGPMRVDAQGAPPRNSKPGAYFGVPLPIWVMVFLAGGLVVGVLFPENRVANTIYTTGTYFPKAVVTFATLIIFAILSGATAKLVLLHRREAGRREDLHLEAPGLCHCPARQIQAA